MRFRVVILGILYTVCLDALAQQTNDAMSGSTPNIFINENYEMGWEGFPAYSDTQKTILLVDQKYSCCISNKIELQELKLKTLTKHQGLILAPREDSPPLTQSQQEKIINRVSNLLKGKNYRSMLTIDSFSNESENPDSVYRLSLKLKEESLETVEFRLPQMTLKKYCCDGGVSDNQELCHVNPEIQKVWISPDTKFALIKYGIIHQMDGCDKGPDYLLIKVNRK